MKSRFLIAVVSLVSLLIAMAAYVGWRAGREPIQTGQPSIVDVPAETDAEDTETAFIRLGAAPNAARPGTSWSVGITTNAWANCLGDVYDPAGDVILFSNPEDAQATPIAPGSFQWTWPVPRDAAKGLWNIRLLCGTYDNLATAEVNVRID